MKDAIKDAQKQRDPCTKPLEGMTTSKLADKYIVNETRYGTNAPSLRAKWKKLAQKMAKVHFCYG